MSYRFSLYLDSMDKRKKSGVWALFGTILVGLVTCTIYDIIKSQPFLTSLLKVAGFIWDQFVALLNQNVKVWWVLATMIALFLAGYFIRKRLRRDWNAKIGNFTFKQLYDIMRTETIPEQTMAMQLNREDISDIPMLDLFIGFHSILSMGVDLETRDRGILYGLLCPKLHLFGLMDKQDFRYENPDLTTHQYTMSENGKVFWAILNKLSIPNRLKEHKQLQRQRARTNKK